MSLAGLNLWAVLVAAIASFAFGAAWYGVLGKPWMAALGKTKEQLLGPSGKPRPLPLVLAFVADLVIAYVLAGAVGHLGPGQVTLRNGLISAVFLWAGFVATTIAVNNAFSGRKATLTLIDSGHWLAAMLVAGAVIGAFG